MPGTLARNRPIVGPKVIFKQNQIEATRIDRKDPSSRAPVRGTWRCNDWTGREVGAGHCATRITMQQLEEQASRIWPMRGADSRHTIGRHSKTDPANTRCGFLAGHWPIQQVNSDQCTARIRGRNCGTQKSKNWPKYEDKLGRDDWRKKQAEFDQYGVVIQMKNEWQTNQNTIRLDFIQCPNPIRKEKRPKVWWWSRPQRLVGKNEPNLTNVKRLSRCKMIGRPIKIRFGSIPASAQPNSRRKQLGTFRLQTKALPVPPTDSKVYKTANPPPGQLSFWISADYPSTTDSCWTELYAS